MKLENVIALLRKIAPLQLAEEWDNTGLLIDPLYPRNITQILLTIDLTEAVADEAIELGADLIVAYHPILFRPANRLSADNAYDRTVMKLVQHNIAVYSPHTALDALNGGVNDWLAEGLGKGSVSILQPISGTDAGQGRLVELEDPVELTQLTERIKIFLGLKSVRTAEAVTSQPIRTIALCAGAGTDAFKGIKADCYLTGEMSHHNILAATLNGTHIILCEHTNTERGFLPRLASMIQSKADSKINMTISKQDRDPLSLN